ncbi:MAG TPA: hypothetical protein VK426_05750 [Methanobacterium sp.]|nr:hypothetical protein [Methanobacterium sp.]
MISRENIQILGLILIISFIFGCIGSNSNSNVHSENDLKNIKPGSGIVGDSEFEIGTEWYQKSINGYSSEFNFNGSSSGKPLVLMKITQYQNISGYNSDYETLSRGIPAWNIFAGAENIENVEVKNIKKSRIDGSEATMYYFFEKNSKYYQVFIDITSPKYFNDNNLVDKTINSIVDTIH